MSPPIKKRRRGGCVLLALVVIAALVACALGLNWAHKAATEPFQGFVGPGTRFEVPAGTSATTILARLEEQGLIANADLARAYLVYRLGDPPLLAGAYRFEGPSTLNEVLDKLVRGEIETHPVTVIEGLTFEEIADHLAAEGFGERPAFLAAMRDPALIRDLDPEAMDLEGYLFPDTYSFAEGTSEAEIVATLVRTFRERYERQAAAQAEARGWTVRQVVTLASIVEKESGVEEERPLVAGVYAHRLRRGIALYADPTVIYALKRLGRWDGNIRRPDLELDSPYNTYRYPGLPPGPIASPGLASLEAAAAPADTSYLYFVSRNDGTHVFAETLREHNRNVEIWQKRYWRERWAEEGKR